jgi:methionyl-tRNA formyltransferase
MLTVAVICEDDRTWHLPVVERALALLRRENHSVAGVWTCPARLSRRKGIEIPLFYLRTFGPVNFIKLCLFAAVAALSRWVGALSSSRSLGFQNLCERFEVPHFACEGANDPAFVDWVRTGGIDVVVIMVGHILKADTLEAPRLATVNKHAGLLPANRGLLPYFWARLADQEQGVSFHKVIREIDSGEILVQEKVPPERARSLVDFYVAVQWRFAEMLIGALDALSKDERVEPSHGFARSYHSLPARRDYLEFKGRGGRIIRWRDLPAAWNL